MCLIAYNDIERANKLMFFSMVRFVMKSYTFLQNFDALRQTQFLMKHFWWQISNLIKRCFDDEHICFLKKRFITMVKLYIIYVIFAIRNYVKFHESYKTFLHCDKKDCHRRNIFYKLRYGIKKFYRKFSLRSFTLKSELAVSCLINVMKSRGQCFC